jgi:hypothetical protein
MAIVLARTHALHGPPPRHPLAGRGSYLERSVVVIRRAERFQVK